MGAGLPMYGQQIGTHLLEGVDVTLRLHNHQMHVERLLGELAHSFDDRHPEGDVRHKHAIHHVKMDPVGLRTVQHLHIFFQISEIGG